MVCVKGLLENVVGEKVTDEKRGPSPDIVGLSASDRFSSHFRAIEPVNPTRPIVDIVAVSMSNLASDGPDSMIE